MGFPRPWGFHDGDAYIGFGFDKVWREHNIRSLRGMKFMAASPNAERQGTSWVLTAYGGKMQCSITMYVMSYEPLPEHVNPQDIHNGVL